MTEHTHDTVTIKRATVDDAELVAAFASRTFEETFATDNKPSDMEAYMSEAFSVTRMHSELSDVRATFLLAYVVDESQPAGALAGYAKLFRGEVAESVASGPAIELARLYVDKRWFGRGIAQALMSHGFEIARTEGYSTIWLGVWERNWRALAFYRKIGFEACGHHPFLLGTDLQTDVLMARSLGDAE